MLGFVIFVAQLSYGAHCLENRDFQQNLPTEIGKEDQTGKHPFALECDTVFVRRGVTTTVHQGSYLYFAKTSLNSVIKVEGTLILHGSKNAYVYLSGSLDSAKTGFEPGEKPWGGIEVAESGKLVMQYVGMVRAPTPITAFSRQVVITNSFFHGSSGMILPDGSLLPMEPKFFAVNDLDLSKAKNDAPDKTAADRSEGGISESEKAALLNNKEQDRFWTWPKIAGGTAAAALLVGLGVYLLPGGEKSPATSSSKPNTLDPLPPVPTD